MRTVFSRAVGLVACLAAMSLTGCRGRTADDAATAMALRAIVRHPELVHSTVRGATAETIAMLDLTPELAAELKAWSEAHAAEIGARYDALLRQALDDAAKIKGAADQLVAKRAKSVREQTELTRQAAPDGLSDDLFERVPDAAAVAEMVKEFAASLQPLAAKLSDRQQLVVTGAWRGLSEQVSQLVQLAADTKSADVLQHRIGTVTALLDARGYEAQTDKAVTQTAHRLVGRLPLGQPDDQRVEALVTSLFENLPARSPNDQSIEANQSLCLLLSEGSAAELLSLVPKP